MNIYGIPAMADQLHGIEKLEFELIIGLIIEAILIH